MMHTICDPCTCLAACYQMHRCCLHKQERCLKNTKIQSQKPRLPTQFKVQTETVSAHHQTKLEATSRQSHFNTQLLQIHSHNPLVFKSCSTLTSERSMGIPFPLRESLKAVLFDVDGTLCDTDPIHYLAFRDMLQEVGFQGGVPITEEFFSSHISGGQNHYLGLKLFPDWDQDRRDQFLHDKEARFRSLVANHLKPIEGLPELCQWIEKRGLRRAAVTNAPSENAELMISGLGLSNFFELVVIGGECERAKPFPDPYQKALKHFGLSPDEAIVFEDSVTGLTAAVSAGIATVGVASGNPESSLLEAGAAFVIKNFKDTNLWEALGDQPETLTTN